MKLIKQLVHPEVKSFDGNILKRQAARGIVLRQQSILLLFTERYNDFSFPGGGLGPGEEPEVGLQRELEEETGARNVRVHSHAGFIEEYRPHKRAGFDLMHMISHFFVCDVDPELQATRMESHEVANGMRPLWVDLHEAIAHNRSVMQRQEKSMGMSIQRETFMLEKVAAESLG